MQTFENEAVAVLTSTRKAFADFISSTGESIRKPADLKRRLGIDAKLAWRVFRVATARDALSAGIHVPTPAGIATLSRAAARRNVPREPIESVRKASDAFESLVQRHAGDRSSFQSMISAHASEGSEQIDLEHRRAAFRANSHIWGIQAVVQLSCRVLFVGTDRSRLDIASIRGLIGLRRIRPKVPRIVSRLRITESDDGKGRLSRRFEPVDPDGEVCAGVSLLRQFCSDPLPELRPLETSDGMVLGELVGSGVGNESAVTCMTGDVVRSAAPVERDAHNTVVKAIAAVRTPCEVVYSDLVIEVGLFDGISPASAVYGDHQSIRVSSQFYEHERLALRTTVERLGRGAAALNTLEVPRYAEMVSYTLDRMGKNADHFEVYRCRIEYPVMPSSVVVQFDYPTERTK